MKILVLGSNGLVGSSLHRVLSAVNEFDEVIPATRSQADLLNLEETSKLLDDIKPNVVINAAARVGGVLANNLYRSQFLIENIRINVNLLESLIPHPEIKLINLGSSCIYPLNAENPISEESIMTGKLEPTNSAYAMAKLTSIELGDSLSKQYGHNIINLMPTNLYGPKDNFSDKGSHVIPGLMRRFHNATTNKDSHIEIWGTGKPLREFLYVDDLANAIEFLINKNWSEELVNIGSGDEVSIKNLAELMKDITDFKGDIKFDPSKPDGNPRKLLNLDKMNSLGWQSSTTLENGLNKTYDWFIKNIA